MLLASRNEGPAATRVEEHGGEPKIRFFLEGKCSRGNKCSFAHTKQQLREKPDFRRSSEALGARTPMASKSSGSPPTCQRCRGSESAVGLLRRQLTDTSSEGSGRVLSAGSLCPEDLRAGAKNGSSGETLRRAYLTDAASYWKKVQDRGRREKAILAEGVSPGQLGRAKARLGCTEGAGPTQQAPPRADAFLLSPFQKRAKRWSFLEAASRPRRELRSVQVLTAKSDVDGALEAQLAFLTRGGHRLFYLNEEELAELEKLAPRISEYFELWEEKGFLAPLQQFPDSFRALKLWGFRPPPRRPMGRRGQGRGGGGGGGGGDGRDNRSGPVSQLEDLMRRRGVEQAWDALQEMMRAGLPAALASVSRMLMRTLADGRRSWDPAKINRSVALVEQFVQIQPQEADEAKLETTFQRMKDLGVEPSHVTLGILVKAYGQVCDIKKVVQLWDEMVEQREQAVTYGCMINACVKCRGVLGASVAWEYSFIIHMEIAMTALSIFRDMQKRHKQCNTILYTPTLIKGYGNEKDLNTAIMLFREMREEGVPYNTIAYNSIIDVCIKCTEVAKAEEFFQEMMSESSTVQPGAKPDLITYSTLLKGYCQVGDLDKALQACGMQCDELVYNTLMDGCVKANDLSAGVGLFAEMASLYQRNGYKGNALDAVAQLYQHHGLEKPSAAARRENRAKGSKSRNGAGTKQATRARQGPAKQGGYDGGGTSGESQRDQSIYVVSLRFFHPNSVADASQRLPGRPVHYGPASGGDQQAQGLSDVPSSRALRVLELPRTTSSPTSCGELPPELVSESLFYRLLLTFVALLHREAVNDRQEISSRDSMGPLVATAGSSHRALGAPMLDNLGNRFIFPAPQPSYGAQSYKRNLCWIPWNSVISPKRVGEENASGIPCLWFPAPKAATVILFFHANAEDLGMSFAVLRHIRDQFKVNVLAVEYPGYGLLHHMEPSEDAVYEVALTAFRFLVDEIGVRYSQIILFGRSLGSGPAVFLAAQYPVGGLILVSAFSSIKAAVQSIVGRVVAWTFAERFPNGRIIANVSCSTLFIHGESDSLIPAEHSLRLFKRCRARKLLVTPPKMEHNSNLFGDASFLAVPAIHFFGFPGYYTASPPRLQAHLFEDPAKRARLLKEKNKQEPLSSLTKPSWLCDCLAKGDAQHLDVTFCRQENSVEDITIRFHEASAPGDPSQIKGDLGDLQPSDEPPASEKAPLKPQSHPDSAADKENDKDAALFQQERQEREERDGLAELKVAEDIPLGPEPRSPAPEDGSNVVMSYAT
ncbi:Pentatricopeptide repeat-containing protein, chloroplastic [Symbiodinium microadriaticum]|uniref:Pentatricopeptide repeat-containing protein, chloroplastic n=2 Tax=Symbiodinium TaxID=2949 RepID=A0A1Q9DEJ6_SYMMI|nr:Pentatricopeptide repeat-containing protein, chloroplastic [Symbiodinium microadriaticum]